MAIVLSGCFSCHALQGLSASTAQLTLLFKQHVIDFSDCHAARALLGAMVEVGASVEASTEYLAVVHLNREQTLLVEPSVGAYCLCC